MWEFSLNLQAENFELAKSIFNSLKKFSASFGGVVTCHEEGGFIFILIAVPLRCEKDVKTYLLRLITKLICTHFKEDYLEKRLTLPRHDHKSLIAFKKALLNFDRETDYYIIQKNIDFKQSLFLESFYYFSLKNLRAKWAELILLANENKDYLVSAEAFIDLLKFLVDNLEISSGEISVIEEGGLYNIIDDGNHISERDLNEDELITNLIDLAPQKINFYSRQNSATNFLSQIFDERLQIHSNAQEAPKISK